MYISPERGNRLGEWLRTQRRLNEHGNLRSDRLAHLDSLGTWYFSDDGELSRLVKFGRFKTTLRQIQAFVVNGKIKVPIREKKLYSFMKNRRNERKLGTLLPERQEMMDQLGRW